MRKLPDLTFESHVKNIKKELDINPEVLKGTDAKKLIKQFNRIPGNGGFVWIENTVAVINPNRIGTLAHEMRHAWQFKNKDKLNFNFKKTIKNPLAYVVCPKELDANKYARDYCKRMGLHGMAYGYLVSILVYYLFKFVLYPIIMFMVIFWLIFKIIL